MKNFSKINFTTTVPQPQYHNHSTTTTVPQPQYHNHSTTTTVPQPQYHNHSTTTLQRSSLSKILLFCFFFLFFFHCGNKKSGGLGLGVLALAGDGSSSSSTKDIPIPKESQFTIKEITPTIQGGGTFPKYSYHLEYFKDKFYLFSSNVEGKYYSSSDGESWKDEGKPHTNFGTSPNTFILKDQLFVFDERSKKAYSSANPDGTNFREKDTTGLPDSLSSEKFIVLNDTVWFRDRAGFFKSKDALNWNQVLTITEETQILIKYVIVSYEGKIWTFGGSDPKKKLSSLVLSFDETNLKVESNLPKALRHPAAQVFAGGLFVIGGDNASLKASNDVYWWWPDGNTKTWTEVFTDKRLGGYIGEGSVLKSKNEMWIVKQTDTDEDGTTDATRVYRITFTP